MIQEYQLSLFGVEVVATIAGAINPEAEKIYRQSLVVRNSNPYLANILQLRMFASVGYEILDAVRAMNKAPRRIDRTCHA